MSVLWTNVNIVFIGKISENVCRIIFSPKDDPVQEVEVTYNCDTREVIYDNKFENYEKSELRVFLEKNKENVQGIFEAYLLGNNINKLKEDVQAGRTYRYLY